MAEPLPRELIDGRYRVLSRLGAGGMADVFLAEDEQLRRQVALKLLHRRFSADPDFVERFRREAQAAAGLQHPNVVSVYDRGSYDDTYFIAMEYLPGRSLKQLIREEAPLDPVRAIDIAIQILKAARFAHRHGVIHRDLKPHNVIIDDADLAKVTDFGIARAGASDMTETGSIMGTAQYLSPEQAQGHVVGAASDMYSIGVVLYEMLTGRVPFDGESPVAIALKHVAQTPVPPSQLNPAVGPELDQTVLWVLNKDAADRPQNADELIAVLEHCRSTIVSGVAPEHTASMAAVTAGRSPGEVARLYAGAAVSDGTGSIPAVPPPERRRRRRWVPWALAALVLLLIAAAAAAAYLLSRPVQYKVPNVVNEQVALATRVLQAHHFHVTEFKQASGKPVGIVLAEAPKAGTMQDKGTYVGITVSSGPAQVAVPPLEGETVAQATKTLRRLGLKLEGKPLMQASNQVPSGQVIKSDPKAGTPVARHFPVTLYVSSGPPRQRVPGVTGDTQTAATTTLGHAGFNVNAKQQTSTTVAAGNVISQTPAADTLVAPGTTVTIVIATAPATTTVPPVVGDPQAAALGALRAAHFSVSTTYRTVTNPARNGVVISQSPKGNSTQKTGSTVTIVVGRYQHPSSSSSSSSSSSTTTSSSSPSSSTTTSSSSPTAPAGG